MSFHLLFVPQFQVEFYAPWCGHCKNLKPAYAEAATKVKEYDSSILVAKVDATEEKELGKRFSISGFPTLKWFVDGEVATDYNSLRTADGIFNWIKKKTGPPSVDIDSKDVLAKAKEDEVAMFAYFEKFEGDEHENFEKFASKTDGVGFYKTKDSAIAKELGLKKPGFGVSRNYKGFDFEFVSSAGHEAFKGDNSTEEKLAELLKFEKLPAYLEFAPENQPKIFGAGINHHVLVVASEKELAPKSKIIKTIEEVSKKTRGKVVIVTVNKDNESVGPVINFFGIDKSGKEPIVLGFSSKDNSKYSFPEGKSIKKDTLVAFANDVVAGVADALVKSAPIPEEPEEEGVRVVVGKNFDDVVKDPTKDVLLEVYAPWCGHCKALAPTYVDLAKRFKDIDSVVIAKMDGTTNEVAGLQVSGFPTLKFFPAEKEAKPIDFNAGRDLESMTEFIKTNAKISFELSEEKPTEEKTEEKPTEEKTEEKATEDKPKHEEL